MKLNAFQLLCLSAVGNHGVALSVIFLGPIINISVRVKTHRKWVLTYQKKSAPQSSRSLTVSKQFLSTAEWRDPSRGTILPGTRLRVPLGSRGEGCARPGPRIWTTLYGAPWCLAGGVVGSSVHQAWIWTTLYWAHLAGGVVGSRHHPSRLRV